MRARATLVGRGAGSRALSTLARSGPHQTPPRSRPAARRPSPPRRPRPESAARAWHTGFGSERRAERRAGERDRRACPLAHLILGIVLIVRDRRVVVRSSWMCAPFPANHRQVGILVAQPQELGTSGSDSAQRVKRPGTQDDRVRTRCGREAQGTRQRREREYPLRRLVLFFPPLQSREGEREEWGRSCGCVART